MMDTSWIGPAVQSADAARANVWRVQEARHAERFSAYQANTGWQRGVADMRAAGLNPMLAFSEGPSPSPTGVPAPITDSQIGGAISSALQTRRLEADLRQIDATIAATRAAEHKSISETKNIDIQSRLRAAELAGAQNRSKINEVAGSALDSVLNTSRQGFSRIKRGSDAIQQRYDALIQSIFGTGNSSRGVSGEW